MVRSVANRYLAVSRLADDFMDTAPPATPEASGGEGGEGGEGGGGGSHEGGPRAPLSRTEGPLEGPGLVEVAGQWLLLASHLRGWLPSPMELLRLVVDPREGDGSRLAPAAGLGAVGAHFEALEPPTASRSSHYSQCAAVVPYCDADGRPYSIYWGDRWGVSFR